MQMECQALSYELDHAHYGQEERTSDERSAEVGDMLFLFCIMTVDGSEVLWGSFVDGPGVFDMLSELLHLVVMAHGILSGGFDKTSDAQSAMDGQLCFSPIALTSIARMAFLC